MPAKAVLAVLTLVSFFNYLDRMALAVLLEPIRRDLHITDTQAGLIAGLAFALFYAFLGMPIARLADRGNKGRILAGCMVIWSGMTCLTGAAMSFGTLFLARMGVGIGEAGCAPTSFAILSEIFPSQRRPLAISVFQAGGLLGIATGMFMAGIAAQYLGWRLTLGGLGIAGIPIALMVAYTLRDIDASSPRRPTTPTITDLKVLLTRPVILHIIAGISLASFGTYAIIQWSAAFFIRTHGVGLAQIGMVSGLTTGIGGIAGTLGGGWLAGRLIRRDRNWDLRLPAIAYLAAAPIFAATFGVASTNLAFALNFCATTVAASAGGVALASLQRFAEAERRVTANALMLIVSAIAGIGLGPVFVGVISDAFASSLGTQSLRLAMLASSCAFPWASVHFLLAARRAQTAQPL
jgi:predicted MFS family arabinose efflux permease